MKKISSFRAKNLANLFRLCQLALAVLAFNLPLLQTVQAQTWTIDAPLHSARWGHAAVLLTNGLVLIAGGRIANDYTPPGNHANTNSCELYDPASQSSTLTGFPTDSHFAGISMMLTNGLVLLAGGENNGQFPTAGAELYDSSSGTWTSTGSLQQRRASFAAAMLADGRVLVVGGYDGGSGVELSSAEIYSPDTGVWTNAAPMSFSADSQTATLLPNGKVLVAGGSFNGNGLTNAILYDPVNNTWANTGPLHAPRGGHVATLLLDGRVLIIGGGSDEEIYNPNTGTWTIAASRNTGGTFPTATLLPNGQVLVAGGDPLQTDAELYDATNDVWTPTGPLNVGRLFHTATLVAQGQVVVAGGNAGTIGYYNGPPIADVETYNQAASFGPALNTSNLVWNTSGDAIWFVETTNTFDGVSAAQSGLIDDGGTSRIQTTIPSDGQLSFYWKVSSEGGSDILAFYINGNKQDAISGDVDWFQETYHVFAGDVLRWEYSKDVVCCEDGMDAGFLDEVNYSTVAPTPSLHVTASPSTGEAPLIVQFDSPDVDFDGNTVTNWNWDFGDGTSSTNQSPSHTYTNFDSFSPSLVAYSTFGSSPLTVIGPDEITVTNHTLNVTANPEAGPFPLTVQFFSPSVDSGGNAVTNWNWTFGDGGIATSQNPSHIYTNAGTFSPSLVAHSTYNLSPLDVTGLNSITTTNSPNPAFRTLYSFSSPFGTGPSGILVSSGNTLYGTTALGGAFNSGTIYSLNTSSGAFTNLCHFNGTNGARPSGVILSGGTLYGPTDFGGTRQGGTVFAVNTNGSGYTNLYNLNFNVDVNSPSSPQAPVALAGNTLYCATWFGGLYNKGTLYTVATNGTSSGIIHNFLPEDGNNHNSDGRLPATRMIFAGGTLYGTTLSGGTSGLGVVYAIDTNNPGSFRIVHQFPTYDPFTHTNAEGASPYAGLVSSGGTLYGTTYTGGTNGSGVVFAVNTDGSGFTNLHSFTGGNGGANPHAGLALSGTTLYGTTSAGGTSSNGTLFSINTDGSSFTTLYNFTGGADGADPETDLVLSGNILYGTANGGGNSGNGTIFSFTLPTSIVLTDSHKSAGAFQFNFLNNAGTTNTVFVTTNLSLAFSNWTSLGLATEISPGHFQFSDPQATNSPRRFYRVRSP